MVKLKVFSAYFIILGILFVYFVIVGIFYLPCHFTVGILFVYFAFVGIFIKSEGFLEPLVLDKGRGGRNTSGC